MSNGDVLVIKVSYFLKKSQMDQLLLPPGFEATVVPSDVKTVVEELNDKEGVTEDDG